MITGSGQFADSKCEIEVKTKMYMAKEAQPYVHKIRTYFAVA